MAEPRTPPRHSSAPHQSSPVKPSDSPHESTYKLAVRFYRTGPFPLFVVALVFSMMFLAFAIDFPKKLAQESTAMPAPVPQEERMTRY